MTTLIELEGLGGGPVFANLDHVTCIVPKEEYRQGHRIVRKSHIHIELVTKSVIRVQNSLGRVRDAFQQAEIQIRKAKSNG